MTKMTINGKKHDISPNANLQNANLYRANLQGANLQGATLWGADLQNADLQDADLRGANLQGANLQGATLWDANLQGADLRGANLQGANLQGATLWDANLQGATLWDANLHGANLQGADLRGADLRGANLQSAKNIPAITAAQLFTPPQEGSFVAFKKLEGGKIAKLLIPTEARRSSATTRKCRAEFAIVLEGEGVSKFDNTFVYKVGETVRSDKWEEDRWIECGGGIHFFMTKEEAEAY